MEESSESVSHVAQWSRKWQYVLDKSSPHMIYPWILFSVLFAIYCVRVYLVNGWYIITYGLGIYILNQFIGFLSPQFDPDDPDIDLALPTKDSEEYRPFARRLPEFKFWYSCSKAVVISFFLTFFEVFDIPVFWPILVFYFIALFIVTMKRQISHMIKHRYVPWSWGKAKYGGSGSGGKSDK